jgi:hypothetical protein
MSKFDFEANRGNVPKNTGFDFEANRKPVPEPLPFNKPFDFEANRGNIPKPATIRYDFDNNPENYKPRGQTITIVEDENRERNSWGYNSMLAGTTLLGVGAVLGSQMYQIFKGVDRARGKMRQPRFASMDRAKGVIKEKIIEEGGRIPQRNIINDFPKSLDREVITQSQILTPLGGVITSPDRGLANNPIYKTGKMSSLRESFSNLVGEPKGRFSKGGSGTQFDFSKQQLKQISDNL